MITNCGVVYGLFAKKAGKTLNVSTEEGQIVINTIKREIPKTIKNITYYPPSPAAGHGLRHHRFHDI